MILPAGDRSWERFSRAGQIAAPCGKCPNCDKSKAAVLATAAAQRERSRLIPVTSVTGRAGDRWWVDQLRQQLRGKGFDFSPTEAIQWAERFEPVRVAKRHVMNIASDERGFISFIQQGALFGDGQFELVYSGSVSGIWRPKVAGEQFAATAGQTITFRVNNHRPMSWIGAACGGYGGASVLTSSGDGGGGGAWQNVNQPFTVLTGRLYTITVGGTPSGNCSFVDGVAGTIMNFAGGGAGGFAGPGGVGGVVITGTGNAGNDGATGETFGISCSGGASNGANATGNGGAPGGGANDGGTGAGCGGATACGLFEAPPDGFSGGGGGGGCGFGGGGGGQGASSTFGGGPGGSAYRFVVGPAFFVLYA